jgi:4a-hydroxytetrahydrobiopterin dehydratase
MLMADLLAGAELDAALQRIPTWARDGNAITKQFQFNDFRQAMWFLNASAAVADLLDHHPEWSNVYNRVTVRLSTHDAGGLTDKDIALAHAMDKAAG